METKSNMTGLDRKPQMEQKHPDEWAGDLSPNHMAGQNLGEPSALPEQNSRTAYDIREVHRSLRGFADDELKQIPVLSAGARLHQGATYFDLNDPNGQQFTATGDIEAEPDNWYVPKRLVPYPLWNRLIGVDNPDRTLQAPAPEE